ncbi:glutathione S-transferase N-terminal domain-containing protein [Georgfuchsia toluolica]
MDSAATPNVGGAIEISAFYAHAREWVREPSTIQGQKAEGMGNTIKGVSSLLPFLTRLARGTLVKGHRKLPVASLELYEAEFCPHCRYVREALTELDLDAMIHPIPKDGNHFLELVIGMNGKGRVQIVWMPPRGIHTSASIDPHGDRTSMSSA